MKIGFYIGSLLYQHDCVVIPDFGGFIANYASAHIHPVQNTFIPPSRQIMFNASLLHNDGLLASHIARAEGISYADALIRIDEEVVAIHKELNSGRGFLLEGFGSLRANHEHNIVFTPNAINNYLEDAYGLPTFVSPAIKRTGFQSNQDIKNERSGIRLPVAVRRIAAIAIPLIAIGMWSLFNTDRISNFTSNYSSIFPSEILSPFSMSSIKNSIPFYVLSHASSSVKKTKPEPADTKGIDANVNAVNTISQPEVTSKLEYTENKSETKISVPQPISSDIGLSEPYHYLIITGAFKMRENAEKLLGELKAKNFDAILAGQNKKGLYLVSVGSCNDANQAVSRLKEIRDKGIEAAWILKNQD